MESVDIGENTTLLIDFNNLAIRAYFGAKEITEDPNDIQWGLWRYNVFNSIYHSLWKVKNVKEVIIAIDDIRSWRKAFYSRYKESRKKRKKDSKFDWDTIYTMMQELASDLKHHMPFKILKVKSAEADDIIGVLTPKLKNPCVIIARDEDYFQLFGRKQNLKIYDPISQILYSPDDFEDIKDFLLKLVFCGQTKDDIPNILTPNDWGLTEATEGRRKPGFGVKSFDKIKHDIKGFIQKGYTNKIYGKVDLHETLKRNRLLMDFDKIPNTIITRIVNCYNSSYNFPPIDNIYLFFEKHKMRVFIDNIHKVEQKLQILF